MTNFFHNTFKDRRPSTDFFEYWDSLGFFDNLQSILPPQFFIIFEIARLIFTPEMTSDALIAINDISEEERGKDFDRDEAIMINRIEKISPLSDNMEIDTFRNIYDMRKVLPRELALDDWMFDIKLLTKTLIVQKYYESEGDRFKPVSNIRDESGRDANRFEQKFFLLLDRSRSMDFKMRSFFSKCIVAEFLRRKFNSNAKIFYRPFDTKAGSLFKVERVEDFPLLIERILFTTTGGKSTNLQEAVIRAIDDINYDKEMSNAEILVVTDGISRIDRYALKKKLGDIKLNILKIGKDMAEPDVFEIKGAPEKFADIINKSMINIREIKKRLSDSESGKSSISLNEKQAYIYLLDYSERMFKDIKDVSYRFVEIPDLNPTELFKLTDENLDFIESSVDEFMRRDCENSPPEELKRIYKQACFLNQYIVLLMEYGDNADHPVLKDAHERLHEINQKLLKNPTLYEMVMRVSGLDEDRKTMKLARKETKKRLRDMKMDRHISSSDIKKAQLALTMDAGGGSGQLLRMLLIKFLEFLKRIFSQAYKGQ